MQEEIFEKYPIPKAYFKLALPVVFSMVISLVYNMVDTYFIAGTGNTDLVAGVALGSPIFTLMIALGDIFGLGGSSFISRLFGEKRYEDAKRISVFSFYGAIVSGVAVAAVLMIFRSLILGLLGASEATWEYASQYYTCIALGEPFIIVALTPSNQLRTEGFATASMVGSVLGAVVNIILDPILIFGLFGFPRMEVAGAAVATVTGQIVAAVAAIILNQKKNHEVKINMKGFRPSVEVIAQIYEIGIPSIVMQAISSVMTYGMNLILISFSATATAVFGIYFKLQSFIFMPVFGLNNGVIPIVAYNYGAQKKDRVLSAIRHVITYAVVIMILGLVIFQTMPDKLLMMFSASETMLAIGVPALRTISLSFLLAGFCIAAGSVFQALGKSIYSMYVSVARQLVVLLPAAYALSRLGRVELVWWAIPIAELMSLAMTVVCMIHINKNIISKIGKNS